MHSDEGIRFKKQMKEKCSTSNEFLNRGNAKSSLRKYEEAIKDYDKAIGIDSNYVAAYNNRGSAKDDLGEYEEAIKDYDKAIGIDSNYVVAYNNRGNAKSKLREYEEAIKDYDKAIGIDSNYVATYNNRGNAKSKLREYEEAIKDYDKAIGIDSNYVVAYNNRGSAKSKLREYEEAIKDYDKAIGIDSNYVAAYNNRGSAKDDLGEYEEAIKDYDKAIGIDSNYVAAYNNRGNAKSKLREYEEAIKDYDKAIGIDSNYVATYNNRGNAKSKLREYEEAIKDYDKAIGIDSNYVVAYNNRGSAKSKLREYEEAIKDYDKAIGIDSNYVAAYNNRGSAKDDLGEYEEAIKDYDKAIGIDSNYVVAYNNRGNAKSKLREYEEAIKDYDKAIGIDSNYVVAYNNRGNAKSKLRKYEEAIGDYDKVIKINPHNIQNNFQLFLVDYFKDIEKKTDRYEIIKLFLELHKKINDFIEKKCSIDNESENIYHYTSVKSLKKMINKEERVRFYSVQGMNDPNEGKSFLNRLCNEESNNKNFFCEIQEYYNETQDHNETQVYILSFVGGNKSMEESNDNLIHWRSYGKGDGIDCNGVNIQYDSTTIQDHNVPKHNKNEVDKKDIYKLRKVYYNENGENKLFQKFMICIDEIGDFCKKNIDIKKIVYLLSICFGEIRFLIKDKSYASENEVRLVRQIYGRNNDKFNGVKIDEEKDPPRFYLEYPKYLKPKSIMLGPKLEKKHQWKKYIEYHEPDCVVKYSNIKFE